MQFRTLPLYAVLLMVMLPSCSKYYLPSDAEPTNYRMTVAEEPADTDPLHAIIAPYKTALDGKMNSVIGEVSGRLFKEKPESPLGNWVADALQTETQAISKGAIDASVQNYGGLRIPELPAGPVTLGKIYELMPFDNMQVIVEMPGSTTQRFFDLIAADGGWPVSKEVQFVLKGKRADRLTISGKPIDPQAIYRIALPDYIANGGGDADFLIDLPRENTGLFVRDLLIRHIQKLTEQGLPVSAISNGQRILWGD